MEDAKRLMHRPTNGQPAALKDVYGTSVKRKSHYPKSSVSRPSGMPEPAGESERQFKMLPVEVPCEVLLNVQSILFKRREFLDDEKRGSPALVFIRCYT